MNTRKKMYRTNTEIRKFLIEKGFHSLFLFPHLRYIKDYQFEGYGFDAIGWKGKIIYLFQFKTNCKPTKKTLEDYKIIEKKYYVKLRWINKKRGEIETY